MIAMSLRPATMDDAALLFAWRNDPGTRENSISTEPVAWDDHVGWLGASLSNPERTLLIAEIDGTAVGTVRIDGGDEDEISWTIAPDWRGFGTGKLMVEMASFGRPMVARIKPCNIASQKIAEHAGFKLAGVDGLQIWRRP